MAKPLTNEQIQEFCTYIVMKTEPHEIDNAGDIWVTPNTLVTIFNKSLRWAYNLAKTYKFPKKKIEGNLVFRYRDFYEAVYKVSYHNPDNNSEYTPYIGGL